LIAEIKVQETKAYQENIQQLQSVIRSKDKEFQALKAQRETEMGAMVAIIKAAQQKIDLFQHQMKVHAQTLAMYREREEKAKRSPVLFMVLPPPSLILLSSHLCSFPLPPSLTSLTILPLTLVLSSVVISTHQLQGTVRCLSQRLTHSLRRAQRTLPLTQAQP
jgi:hypothetical protein